MNQICKSRATAGKKNGKGKADAYSRTFQDAGNCQLDSVPPLTQQLLFSYKSKNIRAVWGPSDGLEHYKAFRYMAWQPAPCHITSYTSIKTISLL
jgi:hypothetical protein